MKRSKSKMLIQFGVAASLALGGTACTLRARQKNQDKANDKTKIVVADTMAANELSDAGEQLVTPYTFMLADKTFSMALEKDPNNGKAKFYKAFLIRFMAFKGILSRIKPMLKPEDMKGYQNTVQNMPETPLKRFLLDGPEDIRDAYSAQSFLNHYVRSVNEFREFLVKNPELDFVINLNPYLYEERIREDWGKSCKVIPNENGNPNDGFQVECNPNDVALRKVNAADLLVLRQISAGEILAFSLYASYSLDGYDAIAKRHPNFNQLDYKVQRDIIMANPHLLTLRPDHVMWTWTAPSEAKDPEAPKRGIAQDLVAAVRWAEKYQKQICPKDTETSEDQRPGYLFAKGLCLPKTSEEINSREQALAMIEKAIVGTISIKGTNSEGKEFDTEIDPLIISKRPIFDLKKLMPAELTPCGQQPILPDPTLGGIFPRGDAAQHMGPGVCNQ